MNSFFIHTVSNYVRGTVLWGIGLGLLKELERSNSVFLSFSLDLNLSLARLGDTTSKHIKYHKNKAMERLTDFGTRFLQQQCGKETQRPEKTIRIRADHHREMCSPPRWSLRAIVIRTINHNSRDRRFCKHIR